MSEPLPPSEPVASQEQTPVTYERVFEAVRALKAAHIKDPFDGSPQSNAVQELLKQYEEAEGLSLVQVSSEESIDKLCRLARVWLDAGYMTTLFRTAVLDVLRNILSKTASAYGEESAIVERVGLHIFEVETGPGSPFAQKEKRAEKYVASGMRDAEALAAAGKLAEAVQLLNTIDTNEDTRELRLIVREKLHALRRTYKTKLEAPNLKQELFTRVEADVRQYIETTYAQPDQAEMRQGFLTALTNQDHQKLRSLHGAMSDAADQTIERKTPEFKTFQYLIHYLGQWLKAE